MDWASAVENDIENSLQSNITMTTSEREASPPPPPAPPLPKHATTKSAVTGSGRRRRRRKGSELTDSSSISMLDPNSNKLNVDINISDYDDSIRRMATSSPPLVSILPSMDITNIQFEDVSSDVLSPIIPSYELIQNLKWIRPAMGGAIPRGRNSHMSCFIKDKLYLFGGWDGNKHADDLSVLDISSMMWSQIHLNTDTSKNPKKSNFEISCRRRYATSAVKVGSRIFTFGGFASRPGAWLSDVIILDISRMEWESPIQLPDLKQPQGHGFPAARAGHTQTLLPNDKLMIFGGNGGDEQFNDLWLLDCNNYQWAKVSTGGSRPSPRSGHTATLVPSCGRRRNSLLSGRSLSNGCHVWVFGGGVGSATFNDVFCLDVETMQWIQPPIEGEAPCCRVGHTATRIGWNIIFFGGGDMNRVFNDCYVLDTIRLTWSKAKLDTAPPARAGHTANLVKGMIFVFGGGDLQGVYGDMNVIDCRSVGSISEASPRRFKSDGDEAVFFSNYRPSQTGENQNQRAGHSDIEFYAELVADVASAAARVAVSRGLGGGMTLDQFEKSLRQRSKELVAQHQEDYFDDDDNLMRNSNENERLNLGKFLEARPSRQELIQRNVLHGEVRDWAIGVFNTTDSESSTSDELAKNRIVRLDLAYGIQPYGSRAKFTGQLLGPLLEQRSSKVELARKNILPSGFDLAPSVRAAHDALLRRQRGAYLEKVLKDRIASLQSNQNNTISNEVKNYNENVSLKSSPNWLPSVPMSMDTVLASVDNYPASVSSSPSKYSSISSTETAQTLSPLRLGLNGPSSFRSSPQSPLLHSLSDFSLEFNGVLRAHSSAIANIFESLLTLLENRENEHARRVADLERLLIESERQRESDALTMKTALLDAKRIVAIEMGLLAAELRKKIDKK